MEYAFRETKKESRRFRLEDDALIYTSSSKGQRRIAYEDISRIQLFSPATSVFVCRIKTRNDGQPALANRSFIATGVFEHHDEKYREFVRALHAKTARLENVQHISGLRWFYWFSIISLILVLAGGLLALGLIIWSWTQDKLSRARPWTIITPLLIFFAFGLPVLLYAIKRGKGGQYQADDIPAEALPPAS